MNTYISTHRLSEITLPPAIAQAADELRREGESPNTVRSYRTAIRYWAAWHALRFGSEISLPLPAATVIHFVVDHAQRSTPEGLQQALPAEVDAQLVQMGYKAKPGPLSLATLNHRIAVLSRVHKQRALNNPCDEPQVRELLSRTRRAYASRGVRPARKPALTRERLQRLLATCDDSLAGQRDRALLLFALATGGRRRSEVVGATCERLQAMGAGQYVYLLGQSKANQSAADDPAHTKPVVGEAARALDAWLAASGIRSGALFRRIRGNQVVGEGLNAATVRRIVIRRAAMAGLKESFSAHSLRSGFLTEAGMSNIPLGEAMALSGHASVRTAMMYFRAGDVLTSRAARLFDSTPPPEDKG
jgi:integrase